MVLWTVLAGDYSVDSAETVLDRIDRFITPGSIIVFHDTRDGGGEVLEIARVEVRSARKIADVRKRTAFACENDPFRAGLG